MLLGLNASNGVLVGATVVLYKDVSCLVLILILKVMLGFSSPFGGVSWRIYL